MSVTPASIICLEQIVSLLGCDSDLNNIIYCDRENLENNMIAILHNNSTALAGNEIYGGWIDTAFKYLEIKVGEHDHYAVTSDSVRICICINTEPNCNIMQHFIKVFPGQTFEIEAVAVGQRLGINPGIVFAEITVTDENGIIAKGQSVQSVGRLCTSLEFTVFSTENSAQMSLRSQYEVKSNIKKQISKKLPPYYSNVIFDQLLVNITLKSCPLGFHLDIDKLSK